MTIRLALVEDNETIRTRFAERIRFFDDVRLVLSASSGDDFLNCLETLPSELRPHVVLMDIEMPGRDGIETTALLKDRHDEIDVMMLTVFDDEDRIFAAIRAGASGYLLKDASAGQIVGAALEMVRGGAPMSPVVARKMLRYVRGHDAAPRSTADVPDEEQIDLTPREMDILHLLVEDLTEALIADRLHISPHTVRTHIKNIYKKMHVHSRASAVRTAYERRLLR